MNYELTFLDDKEFEKLPYRDTHSSLGLADTKRAKAYVRRTGVKVVDAFTALHELEHLEGDALGEHEKYGDGVYYKDFGSALSGAGQSIGGAFNSIGGGISNAAGSLTKAMNFGGGFQGGANPSGGLAAAAASNPALRAPAGVASGFSMPQGATSMLSTQGMAWPQQSPVSSLMSSPSTKSPMSSTSQSFPISASVEDSPKPQTQAGGGLGASLGNMGMQLLQQGGQGLLSKFMGSATQGGGNGSRLPDMGGLESVQAFKNFDLRGGINELDPALAQSINADFDQMDQQELKEFQSRWKNIRPGADIESDSVYKRDYDNLVASQQKRRAGEMAKYRFENIKTQLGINQLEAERLQTLAQLDVNTIATNTGLDFAEANQLKEMFSGQTEQQPQGGGLIDTLLRPAVSSVGQRMGGYVGNLF